MLGEAGKGRESAPHPPGTGYLLRHQNVQGCWRCRPVQCGLQTSRPCSHRPIPPGCWYTVDVRMAGGV